MKEYIAFFLGILIGGTSMYYLSPADDNHTHDTQSDAYHVHSDWVYILQGERVDLTGPEFQTTATQTTHPHLHLHDNDDRILHIHKEEQLFVDFLDSLDITLTDSCLTHLDGTTYCNDDTTEVTVYVNKVAHPDPASYVPQDEDQILLYVGPPDAPQLTTYFDSITDEACIYTGTCPERGTAPPEACGITCEL